MHLHVQSFNWLYRGSVLGGEDVVGGLITPSLLSTSFKSLGSSVSVVGHDSYS